MGILGSPKYHFLCAFQFFLLVQTTVFCYQYKVGDLDAWGTPTSENPQVYIKWSKNHIFKIGDSLLFLYPPSQDSVIQVKEQSFSSCNIKDPILHMNNGNSLFNITSLGEFYFISGVLGNCEKSQKLHISVPGNGSSSAFSPSYVPTALPATSPSSSSSSSSSSLSIPALMSTAIGFLVASTVSGRL